MLVVGPFPVSPPPKRHGTRGWRRNLLTRASLPLQACPEPENHGGRRPARSGHHWLIYPLMPVRGLHPRARRLNAGDCSPAPIRANRRDQNHIDSVCFPRACGGNKRDWNTRVFMAGSKRELTAKQAVTPRDCGCIGCSGVVNGLESKAAEQLFSRKNSSRSRAVERAIETEIDGTYVVGAIPRCDDKVPPAARPREN